LESDTFVGACDQGGWHFGVPLVWSGKATPTVREKTRKSPQTNIQEAQGKENVRKALEDYLDGASFVLDQSLRGILAGLGPDDLRHFVTFPKYLDDAPFNLQNYGEISTYSPAIFCQAIGWYDNNAANMKPISPSEEAKRLVPFMGGREKVHPGAKLTTAASPPYQQPSLCRDRPMGPAMLRRKVCRDT
jgi:hypothetical protein